MNPVLPPPNVVQKKTLVETLATWKPGDLSLPQFLTLTVQFGLLLLVARRYGIEESQGFNRMAPLLFGGFVVHALLPLRFRMPFFLLLSVVAIGLHFGYPHSVMLLGLGLGLIGLCHLPVAFGLRVAAIVLFAAFLVVLRAEWIETRWTALPTLVLPALGSMFMFRLIIYLYDLRHEQKSATIWERLTYFFMLPNVFFLFFPVVDYQTYRRTYYDQEANVIYQKGVRWIARGIIHLLLYRVVYHHFLPDPATVGDLGGVVQYMLATYLLYLRISGLFHLIVGLMCLFGFNLPETHHLYYLASSFNDYWRRINIYWKDFMMKLFYYPSFMWLRRFGMKTALVISTIIVFAGTLLLHSYQWFWFRGTFPLLASDVLFWGILGGLVVINSLREAKQGRKRVLGKPAWSLRDAVVHAAKVVGMFVTICVLWTLWSTPQLGEFVALLRIAAGSSAGSWALLAAGLVGLILIGVLVQYINHRSFALTRGDEAPSLRRSAVATGLAALVLLGAAWPPVQQMMGENTTEWLAPVQTERLNRQDEQEVERGYYEGLLNTGNFTSTLWKTWAPKDWGNDEGYMRLSENFYVKEPLPNAQVVYRGAPLSTNRWGMRDGDYEQTKPPQTYRIALLGDSHVMGAGVRDGETFEALLEERLNREHAGRSFARYEILNFSAPAYTLLQNVLVHDEKVAAFEPDAVFYVAHPGEADRIQRKLNSLLRRNIQSPYSPLQEILAQAGVRSGMTSTEIRRLVHPYGKDIIRWGYRHIVETARARGYTPVWVLVPLLEPLPDEQREIAELRQLAMETGFVPLDLTGVYDAYDKATLMVAPWDAHPNALGHQLVADRLYQALLQHEPLIQLGLVEGSVAMQSP